MSQLFKQYILKIATPYRLFGYTLLFLMVLIYNIELDQGETVIYLPAIFLGLYILNQWAKAIFAKTKFPTRYIAFGFDMIAFFIALWYVNFNAVLLVLALVAVFYGLVYRQRKLEHVLIFILLTLISLTYSSQIEFQEHLSVFTLTNFILYISLFSGFLFSGSFAQSRKVDILEQQNRYYYKEMMHYIDFSSQISRYAPLQLWQSILHGEAEAKIEYNRKKLTIFFSDIQGFTQLSETLIPEDLAYLLNEYLRHMTQIARQYGATIDKFMGDGILIFFGDIGSKGVEEDAKTCVNMALAMQQQMKVLRERWQKMGYPALHVRIGITTGYCHVGNYGTADRMAYTIVGREANLAARIQAQAKVDEVLINDSTYQLIRDEFLCIKEKPVLLKGIDEFITTWQVFERYEKGMLNNQQYFDYEYNGFNLLLDLNMVDRKQFNEVIHTLELTKKRIEIQRDMTNADGAIELSEADKVKSDEKSNINPQYQPNKSLDSHGGK